MSRAGTIPGGPSSSFDAPKEEDAPLPLSISANAGGPTHASKVLPGSARKKLMPLPPVQKTPPKPLPPREMRLWAVDKPLGRATLVPFRTPPASTTVSGADHAAGEEGSNQGNIEHRQQKEQQQQQQQNEHEHEHKYQREEQHQHRHQQQHHHPPQQQWAENVRVDSGEPSSKGVALLDEIETVPEGDSGEPSSKGVALLDEIETVPEGDSNNMHPSDREIISPVSPREGVTTKAAFTGPAKNEPRKAREGDALPQISASTPDEDSQNAALKRTDEDGEDGEEGKHPDPMMHGSSPADHDPAGHTQRPSISSESQVSAPPNHGPQPFSPMMRQLINVFLVFCDLANILCCLHLLMPSAIPWAPPRTAERTREAWETPSLWGIVDMFFMLLLCAETILTGAVAHSDFLEHPDKKRIGEAFYHFLLILDAEGTARRYMEAIHHSYREGVHHLGFLPWIQPFYLIVCALEAFELVFSLAGGSWGVSLRPLRFLLPLARPLMLRSAAMTAIWKAIPGLAMVDCVTAMSLLAIAAPSSVAYRGAYHGRCVWGASMGFVDVAASRPPYAVLCRSDDQCEEGQLCSRSEPHKNLHTPSTNSRKLADDPFGSFSDSCLAILQVAMGTGGNDIPSVMLDAAPSPSWVAWVLSLLASLMIGFMPLCFSIAVLNRTFPVLVHQFSGIGSAIIFTFSIGICFVALLIHGGEMDASSGIQLACNVAAEGRMWARESLGKKATKLGAVFALVCTHIMLPLMIVAIQVEIEHMARKGKVWPYGGVWHETQHEVDDQDEIEKDPAPSLCELPRAQDESQGSLRAEGFVKRRSNKTGVSFEEGGLPRQSTVDRMNLISMPGDTGDDEVSSVPKDKPGVERRNLMDIVSMPSGSQADTAGMYSLDPENGETGPPQAGLFASMSTPEGIALSETTGVAIRAKKVTEAKGWNALELDIEAFRVEDDVADKVYLGFDTYPGWGWRFWPPAPWGGGEDYAAARRKGNFITRNIEAISNNLKIVSHEVGMMTSTLRRRSSELTSTMVRQTTSLSSAMASGMRRGSTTASLNGTIPEGEEDEEAPERSEGIASDSVTRQSSRKPRFWRGTGSNKIASVDSEYQPPCVQDDSWKSERRTLAESPGSSDNTPGSTPGSVISSMMSSTPGSTPAGMKRQNTWRMWRSSSANNAKVQSVDLSEGREDSYQRMGTRPVSMESFSSLRAEENMKKLRMERRRRRRQKMIDNATWRKGIWGRRLAVSQGVPIILWGDIAAMLLAASACLLPPGSKFNLSWNENVYSQSAVYALNISANVCLSISFFIEFVYPRPRRGMIATLRLLVDVFVIVSSLTEIDPSNAFGNGVFKAWFVFRPIIMLEGFKSIESVSGGIERGFFGAVMFTAIFMAFNFLVANVGYMMIGKTALGQGDLLLDAGFLVPRVVGGDTMWNKGRGTAINALFWSANGGTEDTYANGVGSWVASLMSITCGVFLVKGGVLASFIRGFLSGPGRSAESDKRRAIEYEQPYSMNFILRLLEPKNNQSKRARKTILKKEFKAFSAFAAAAGFSVTLVYHNSTCPAFLEFIMAALLTFDVGMRLFGFGVGLVFVWGPGAFDVVSCIVMNISWFQSYVYGDTSTFYPIAQAFRGLRAIMLLDYTTEGRALFGAMREHRHRLYCAFSLVFLGIAAFSCASIASLGLARGREIIGVGGIGNFETWPNAVFSFYWLLVVGGHYSASFEELTITPPECTATLLASGNIDIHTRDSLDCAMFGYSQFIIASFKVYFAWVLTGIVSGCLADSYRISRGSIFDTRDDEIFRRVLGRLRAQWERVDDGRVGLLSILKVKDVLDGAGYKSTENRLMRASLQIMVRKRREKIREEGAVQHDLVSFKDLVDAGEQTIWATRHPWLEDMVERVCILDFLRFVVHWRRRERLTRFIRAAEKQNHILQQYAIGGFERSGVSAVQETHVTMEDMAAAKMSQNELREDRAEMMRRRAEVRTKAKRRWGVVRSGELLKAARKFRKELEESEEEIKAFQTGSIGRKGLVQGSMKRVSPAGSAKAKGDSPSGKKAWLTAGSFKVSAILGGSPKRVSPVGSGKAVVDSPAGKKAWLSAGSFKVSAILGGSPVGSAKAKVDSQAAKAWNSAGTFQVSAILGREGSENGEAMGPATSGQRSLDAQAGASDSRSWLGGAFSRSGMFNKKVQSGNASPLRLVEKRDSGSSGPVSQVFDQEDAMSSIPEGSTSSQLRVHPLPEVPGAAELK